MGELTHISLFAGIGGIDIAAEWAGFRTILFVEIDPFCQKVLRKHWPDVPIIGDIKDVTEEAIANATIQRLYNQENKQELEEERGDKLHFKQPRNTKAMANTKSYRESRRQSKDRARERVKQGSESEEGRTRAKTISPVTLVTGGFPCQPVSQAGKRGGKEDDRWLWPDMLRVISEVRPTWVVAENVTGLLTMGFYDCLSDLEGQGYETIPFVIPACSVNAPHRRDRIFIVANSECQRWGRRHNGNAGGGIRALQTERPGAGDKQEDVAISCREGLQDLQGSRQDTLLAGRATPCDGSWWNTEPNVGRVAHGVPGRVDRLKCLGNAVVPQQIYPILKAIAEIERWT